MNGSQLQSPTVGQGRPDERAESGRDVEPVLEVRGLRTEFRAKTGTVAAVRDVDLSVRPLQRLAVVGESGSGKSAMAMSIVGLLQPPGKVVDGSIKLRGRELRGLSDREMSAVRGKQISLVFQDPMSALDPIRTVGAQLVEVIRQHQDISRRTARRQAEELLGDVGVADAGRRMSDYPHQYSGGMRQRVLIAMALANSPDVVIADEPTTALDVTTQAQVLSLLDRLTRERGTALLMITHNLGVVAGFCDSVKVMYAGQIVEEASSERLFASPEHPYTQALLDCVLRPDQAQPSPLAAIPGSPPDLAKPLVGCAFQPRCRFAGGHDICATTEPDPIQIGAGGSTSTARCHFAGQLDTEATR